MSGKEWEVPILRGKKCEHYVRWKREKGWWKALTRVEKDRRAPQIILLGIIPGQIKHVANKFPKTTATTENELAEFLKHMDKFFTPNTFVRKMEAWALQKKTEKTEAMTWEEYTRTMRKWRDDLTSYGTFIPEENYCIALLQSS